MSQWTPLPDAETVANAHAQRLIGEAAEIRVQDLLEGDNPRTLYTVRNRGGVSTVALLTRDLRESDLLAIMRFRLAQYLMAKFVHPLQVYEAGWQHEPLDHLTKDDVHIISGSAATGEILCYATLRAATDECPATPLRSFDRPLLPVEQTFGWGIYNHLCLLPDVRLSRVRELGRFIKNHGLSPSEILGIRAPIEVGAAIFRVTVGPLRDTVDALVGDLEENVAKRNLDFFHVQTVILRDAVPHVPEQAYLFRHFAERQCLPFAILTADLRASVHRLVEVEEALALSGMRAMHALLSLKRTARCPQSSLQPLADPLPSLSLGSQPAVSGVGA